MIGLLAYGTHREGITVRNMRGAINGNPAACNGVVDVEARAPPVLTAEYWITG